jgi:ribosomal protein S10
MYEEIKKIRIILKAYQVPLLNEACKVVMQTLHEAEEKTTIATRTRPIRST